MMRDRQEKLGINVGISFLSRVSSVPGSPTFIYSQPLINSHIYFAPWILLGAQVFTLLVNRFFRVEEIPVFDVSQGRLSSISVEKFLGFLESISSKEGDSLGSLSTSDTTATSELDFPTQLPPGSPMYIALYLSADYSRELFTPSVITYIPLVSFPGLRGAIPFLVLALLGTILVRCVVDPKTTGAKP